ncbi:MAG: M42 family metallopeptidase [Bacillota bacterium]
MDERLAMFRDLTDAPGVPGAEGEVREVFRRYAAGLGTLSQDNLGSVIVQRRGASDRPRIMLAGHMDEIGFMVTLVTKEGFLRFQTLGGWWDQVLLAQRVIVKTRKGDVVGVIGSKPPHILDPEARKKMVEKKDMFIDIGAASDDEARQVFGVRPGDPIVPDSSFTVMRNEKLLMAKAWDDRVGLALIIDVLKELKGKGHPNTVYGVGTVQEEVGLRGAQTSAHMISPDVGFALEVGIAGDMPGVKEHEAQERLGKGPAILLYDASMVPNTHLRDLVTDTAEAAGIPYQFEAMPGGGTDAGRIHTNAGGAPSLVLCVPCRYIHSHTGIIHRDDYEHAVKLLVAVIQRLDTKTVSALLR